MYRLIIFTLVVLSPWVAYAQDYPEDRSKDRERKYHEEEDKFPKDNLEQKRFDWKRVFIGGGFGASFGTITYVNVSPLLGYYITEKLVGGVGGTYQFLKDNRYTPDLKTNVYGGSVFSRYFIYKGLFAQAEYELLNYEVFLVDYVGNIYDRERVTIPGLLIGGGYNFEVGESSGIALMLMFDVLNHPLSNYPSPIVRMSFNIGL